MVAFPEGRDVLQSIFTKELDCIALAESNSEQIRGSLGSNETKINRVSEYRPSIIDCPELGVLGVS
jgi:hypothetical protein